MIDSQGLFVHDRSINGFLKKAKRRTNNLGAGAWSEDKPHLLNKLNCPVLRLGPKSQNSILKQEGRTRGANQFCPEANGSKVKDNDLTPFAIPIFPKQPTPCPLEALFRPPPLRT